MSAVTAAPLSTPIPPATFAPYPPQWAANLVVSSPISTTRTFELRRSEQFALASQKAVGANSAEGAALERLVEEAYCELLERLPFPPVRIWNFLPRIVEDGGEGQDRYMRFNAGRYRAFTRNLCEPERFDQALPAASAVGHPGEDLVIHALGSREPSVAVANPRQRAPHRYSERFGPIPPCFARARLVTADPRLLLIGGTASVCGEDSVHVGNLAAQLVETAQNLSALIGAAFGGSAQPLAHLCRLRVYHVNAGDLPQIRQAVNRWFASPDRVEWVQAELCRPDLLVEIEGLAVRAEGR